MLNSLQNLALNRVHIASRSQSWMTLLVGGLFLVLFCRGLGEFLVPPRLKGGLMALQLFLVLLIPTLLYLMDPRYFLSQRRLSLLKVMLPFIFCALLSCLVTHLGGFVFGFIYVLFSLFVLWIAFTLCQISSGSLPPVAFHRLVMIWGWVLLLVALQDQLGGVEFPGRAASLGLPRPASLTGSPLHYPIIMALLGMVSFQWFALSSKKSGWISGVAFSLAPLLVLSRSGVFITLFSGGLYVTMSGWRGRRSSLYVALAGLLLLSGLLTWDAGKESSLSGKVIRRMTTAGQTQAEGNSGRVAAWMRGYAIWSETHLLIGEHTGRSTNSTGKFVKDEKIHIAESSILQQMINFGLLGTLCFYAILLRVFPMIHKEHLLLRSAYLAGVAQTAFYQSIEVLPYITLLFLFPAISEALQFHASQRRRALLLNPS